MDSRLDNLMTYTTFHIGVYVSLATALIGAGIFGKLNSWCLKPALCLLVVAGFAGAMIGSNIPDFKDFATFEKADLGFFGLPLLRYIVWSRIEHVAFWLAIIAVSVTYLFGGTKAFKSDA